MPVVYLRSLTLLNLKCLAWITHIFGYQFCDSAIHYCFSFLVIEKYATGNRILCFNIPYILINILIKINHSERIEMGKGALLNWVERCNLPAGLTVEGTSYENIWGRSSLIGHLKAVHFVIFDENQSVLFHRPTLMYQKIRGNIGKVVRQDTMRSPVSIKYKMCIKR